jgi:choline dehydrogenase-like flavoprotein
MNYVIGSGPAGVAAAAALLQRGQQVMMLDAGGQLEPSIQAEVDRLAATNAGDWRAEDVQPLKGDRLRYNSEGTPLKLVFGSDYPYRDVERLQPVDARGVDAYRSFAEGGLSALWGASMLPFSDADFENWPLSTAQMRPYYEAAVDMTGLTAAQDSLARLYPLYTNAATTLGLSAQAAFLWERASTHAAALERQQIHVGRARLAVAQPGPAGHSCAYCGMCLYGCPYGLIYSARTTLTTRLMASAAFTYRSGVIVRKLSERNGRVVIHAVSRDTQQPQIFEADRVYLAAGVFASTAILLESLEARSKPVLLKQSDHFLLPLRLHGFRHAVATERLHTLSQLFIELLDRAVSRHAVHLQLYTYSDFYLRMAKQKLGPLYPLFAPIVERAMERIVLLKGYIHSDESAGIRAALDEGGSGAPVLRLEAVRSKRSREVIRSVMAVIDKNRTALGASPIRLARRLGPPGSGVHVGGSFPMRQAPRAFESDLLGRPVGFERVHVVDSTVFPTLPAAPPTLTIMANAFRIASEAGGL